jgi:hypothetical protein
VETGTAVAVKKGIPHTCADPPPLLSVGATGICIQIGNTEMILALVYISPANLWSDTDITEICCAPIGVSDCTHPLSDIRGYLLTCAVENLLT